MSEEPREYPPAPRLRSRVGRGGPGFLFAALLIVFGGALLLANLGLLRLNWGEILRYWPVLLILLGLDVLFGRRSAAGGLAMGLVTIAVLMGVLWLASRAPSSGAPLFPSGGQASGQIAEPLGGAKKLRVSLDLGAMALKLGAQAGGEFAAEGDWVSDASARPDVSYQVEGDTGVLTIHQASSALPFSSGIGAQSRMTLNLPRDIPIDLEVSSDLGKTELDLSALTITGLNTASRSGEVSVLLPSAGTMKTVAIHADLGALSVQADATAALNIESLDVAASSGSLSLSLPPKGGIDRLDVRGDLGSVTVSIPPDATLALGAVSIRGGSGSLTVGLPSQGKADDVSIKGDLGSVTVSIPGKKNAFNAQTFNIESGSGSLTATLPGQGTYQANLSADLGSITMTLPKTMEAHIEIDPGLSRPEIDSQRLAALGHNAWETLDYKTGDNRALISIKSGSGGVTVNDG